VTRQYLERVLAVAGSSSCFRARDVADLHKGSPRSYSFVIGRLEQLGVLEPEGRRHYYQRGPNWENRKEILKGERMYKQGNRLMVQRGRDMPPEIAERMEKEWHCRKIREYGIDRWSIIVNQRPERLRELLG